MRWILVALIAVHGLIHLIGFTKAFGLAEVAQLTTPISRGMGLLWLGAGLAQLTAAGLYVAAPKIWWAVGLAAVVLSQIVIVTSWSDAKFGTLVNVIVLLAAIYGFASKGPTSFHAEYQRDVQARAEGDVDLPLVTPDDLVELPEPVRCYLKQVGVVGQPHVHHFKAEWDGRIRGAPDEPWMEFTAQQVNFVDEPARFFLMDATRGGLPVDVLHAFRNGSAGMRVKLLSLIPMVDTSGPEMTRAETVTLLNDIALMSPAALLHPQMEWSPLAEHSARVRYTVGKNTVQADLFFNDACELVNFVSDDRLAAKPDGSGMVAWRWSTPMSDPAQFGPQRLASRGEARWHAPDGEYAYMEATLTSIEVNGPVP